MKSFKQFISEGKEHKYVKGMIGYHGTSHEFDDFDVDAARHPGTPSHEIKGIFHSTERSAWNWAWRSSKATGKRARVIGNELNMDNPKDVTSEIKKHQKSGMTFGDAKKTAYANVDRTIHDGVYHTGDGVNPPEYVAFSKDKVRKVK